MDRYHRTMVKAEEYLLGLGFTFHAKAPWGSMIYGKKETQAIFKAEIKQAPSGSMYPWMTTIVAT